MSVRRDHRPLLALAVIGVCVALGQTVAGLDTGLVLLSPALVLMLPLLMGRYLGEERLERLVVRFRPRRRRARSAALTRSAHRPGHAARRRGRLLADALAERGPPSAALTSA